MLNHGEEGKKGWLLHREDFVEVFFRKISVVNMHKETEREREREGERERERESRYPSLKRSMSPFPFSRKPTCARVHSHCWRTH